MRLAFTDAGALAWFRDLGIVMWGLTAYPSHPSLSKLVVAGGVWWEEAEIIFLNSFQLTAFADQETTLVVQKEPAWEQ